MSRELAETIQALPMDEPPSSETLAAARDLAGELLALSETSSGEAEALARACARALSAAADRQVLLVHAVPLVVAAVEQLGRERPDGDAGVHWDRGLAGARYEIETLLPGPVRPDVTLESIGRRRGPGSDTPD